MKLNFVTKTLLAAFSVLTLSVATGQAADMQYMSREDLKNAIASGQSNTLILDLRKTADYEKGHIAGAVSADIDPAMGVTGSDAKGTETLKSVLKAKAGNETGAGKKVILVCYSGAKYAQKGTDLLAGIGTELSSVYTLKGGFKGWTAEDAGADYKKLVTTGEEPGTPTK